MAYDKTADCRDNTDSTDRQPAWTKPSAQSSVIPQMSTEYVPSPTPHDRHSDTIDITVSQVGCESSTKGLLRATVAEMGSLFSPRANGGEERLDCRLRHL